MDRNEFERGKERLAEQRRSAIELVEAGYQAQLRALETYWSLQTGEGSSRAVVSPPPSALPPRVTPPPRQRSASQVNADVRKAFPRFPETYTRHDACEALGYVPYRGALYLSLEKLAREGYAHIRENGSGRRGSVYQKTGAGDPPP
jgi:hypothetical protein